MLSYHSPYYLCSLTSVWIHCQVSTVWALNSPAGFRREDSVNNWLVPASRFLREAFDFFHRADGTEARWRFHGLNHQPHVRCWEWSIKKFLSQKKESILLGTWYHASQSWCKSQSQGCKTQADGCNLWMASLYDSNCITLDYGRNDSFLGWGENQRPQKRPSLSPALFFFPLSASNVLFYD